MVRVPARVRPRAHGLACPGLRPGQGWLRPPCDALSCVRDVEASVHVCVSHCPHPSGAVTRQQ